MRVRVGVGVGGAGKGATHGRTCGALGRGWRCNARGNVRRIRLGVEVDGYGVCGAGFGEFAGWVYAG